MIEKKIVNLNEYKKERLRLESTNLCRIALDRATYIYNCEIHPEPLILKLLKNAAGLLEKKLKIDAISKCSTLPENVINELNIFEKEIHQLAEEINEILDQLCECKSTQE